MSLPQGPKTIPFATFGAFTLAIHDTGDVPVNHDGWSRRVEIMLTVRGLVDQKDRWGTHAEQEVSVLIDATTTRALRGLLRCAAEMASDYSTRTTEGRP